MRRIGMQSHIKSNPDRSEFMVDLQSEMSYQDINKKWSTKPTIKLLFSKYLWGNRQKIWLWNFTHKTKSKVKGLK